MKIDKDITFSVLLVNLKDRIISEVVRLSDETEADMLCKRLNDALDRCEHDDRIEFKVRNNYSDLGKHFESRRRHGRMLKESEYEGYPYRVRYIEWETDGEDVDLPDEVIVDVPEEIVADDGEEEYISDYLSDVYGFLHNGFVFDPLEDE